MNLAYFQKVFLYQVIIVIDMKLKRFLLRYYPPGIILEGTDLSLKEIDVLDLNESTDTNHLAEMIVSNEPLISSKKKHHVVMLLNKLVDKKKIDCVVDYYYLYQTLHAHVLPLTNCAFNKNGNRFITGSYDRTCKIWDATTGKEVFILEGHKNVVYSVAFNNPFGNLIVTGSFDKTAKIWDANNG